jgi:dihydrolipoamide dehydrogenase
MQNQQVDVAIIGAGTAGLNARRQVLREGGKPLLIENGAYGTTCARVGCMPSKLLISAADAAHEIARADLFGIRVAANGWRVDGPAVMERVRRERDRFAGFVVRQTEGFPEEERLRGHARFVGPTTLQVDDHTRVQARAVVVATGSTPFVPPPFDRIAEHVLTSDEVFEIADLPDSLAVIGTGIIALELGQAMNRLGVRVEFFNPFDDLGPFTDPKLRRVAREVLSEEFSLHLQAKVVEATPLAEGLQLRWTEHDGTSHEGVFASVLVAAGRTPNVAGLDLQKTGAPLDAKGVPLWDPRTTQCSDLPIFLAGDVSKHLPLLHEASDEGTIAGANAMVFPNTVAHVRRTPIAVAFTDPQMAMVGLRHADLPEQGIAIGEVSFDNQGRARVLGRNRGLVRLYAESRCCTLVGAEMFGPNMEHMAHLLAWSIQQALTVQDALQMPFYHPVLEEGLRTGLRDLAGNLKILGGCRCEDLAESPGT